MKRFINDDFTIDKVEKELVKNYSLVHFATHAKFNDSLQKSYLTAYKEQINLQDFEKILRQHQTALPKNPIKLLVLSACETASGSDRAILGLSGVAIRAGVINSVGSLWAVEDKTEADLVEEFYVGLIKQGLNPTEALRQAKIKSLDHHPSTWANLILIVN